MPGPTAAGAASTTRFRSFWRPAATLTSRSPDENGARQSELSLSLRDGARNGQSHQGGPVGLSRAGERGARLGVGIDSWMKPFSVRREAPGTRPRPSLRTLNEDQLRQSL